MGAAALPQATARESDRRMTSRHEDEPHIVITEAEFNRLLEDLDEHPPKVIPNLAAMLRRVVDRDRLG